MPTRATGTVQEGPDVDRSLQPDLTMVVGVLAALTGLAVVVEPRLAVAVGTSVFVLVAVGLLALFQGLRAAVGTTRPRKQAALPAVEFREPAPVPGDEFDELLRASAERPAWRGGSERTKISRRLERVAVAVLTEKGDHTPETARRSLREGTWTDDPIATSFFAPGATEPGVVFNQLRRYASLEPTFNRRARHAVVALAVRAGTDHIRKRTQADRASSAGLSDVGTGNRLKGAGMGGTPPARADGPSAARRIEVGEATTERHDPEDPEHRPEVGGYIDRATGRWRGVAAVALLAGATGVLAGRAGLVLAGVIGIAFAAHARANGPPAPDLAVERELSRTDVPPGETVCVTVTVRNEGSILLPDLRVIDGVPAGLAVTEGSPRVATALRPGRAVTVSYAVEADRGEHVFGPVTVLSRGFSGAVERELRLAGPASSLTCAPPLSAGETLPLRIQTTPFTGRVTTDVGGSGVEFHAVREYRAGDPLSRVDWHRRARTGELATLEFRRERAATVVLVVDARAEARVGPPSGEPALEEAVGAAGEAFASLLSTGDRVGMAGFGPGECWLAPGAGDTHRARARDLLATSPAFAREPPDEPFYASLRLRRLRRRLPGEAQVVLFTPLSDDYVVSVARRLDAYGHLVTVVSPDPTGERTTGRQLARIERDLRLSRLRRHGLRVVDWGDEPFAAALARAHRRWSHG